MVTTIDCDYFGLSQVAATYLVREGGRAAFIETNTNHAVPRMLAALAEEGLGPEDVDWVIITHVHLDHAGGAARLMAQCPNATLLCHPKAARHVIDPSKLVQSSEGVYGKARFEKLYGTIEPIDEARVRVMEDGEELAWGERTFTFLHTRGHANHHFCIHDSGSNGVFTGDAFGILYPGLQANGLVAFPSSTPTDFDAVEAKRSVERIVATGADHAFLTHFGQTRELEAVGAQLVPQIERFGAIVDEADSLGLEGEALDEYCDGQVRDHFDRLLTQRGLTKDPTVMQLLEIDISLNAQGLAFAVRKRRFKRAR